MKVKEKKLVDETLGETEGARRATGVSPNASPPAGPGSTTMGSETEVVAKAQRRRFTAEDKRRRGRGGGPGGGGGSRGAWRSPSGGASRPSTSGGSCARRTAAPRRGRSGGY